MPCVCRSWAQRARASPASDPSPRIPVSVQFQPTSYRKPAFLFLPRARGRGKPPTPLRRAHTPLPTHPSTALGGAHPQPRRPQCQGSGTLPKFQDPLIRTEMGVEASRRPRRKGREPPSAPGSFPARVEGGGEDEAGPRVTSGPSQAPTPLSLHTVHAASTSFLSAQWPLRT